MWLKHSLSLLCGLYNQLRATNIERYRQSGASLTRTDLRNVALEYRRKGPELQTVFSQVVQNVAERAAEAFRNYFEGRASFPRNKKPRKYLSLIRSQASKSRMEGCIYHRRGQDLHAQANRRQYSEAHH